MIGQNNQYTTIYTTDKDGVINDFAREQTPDVTSDLVSTRVLVIESVRFCGNVFYMIAYAQYDANSIFDIKVACNHNVNYATCVYDSGRNGKHPYTRVFTRCVTGSARFLDLVDRRLHQGRRRLQVQRANLVPVVDRRAARHQRAGGAGQQLRNRVGVRVSQR